MSAKFCLNLNVLTRNRVKSRSRYSGRKEIARKPQQEV